MKQCPACHEMYNDTWKKCLRDETPLDNSAKPHESARTPLADIEDDQKYKTLGGWLALYVWVLLIFGPIGFVMIVYSVISGNGNLIYPLGLPLFMNIAYAGLSLAETIAGIFLLIPKPRSVWYARSILSGWALFRIVCVYMVKDRGIGDIAGNIFMVGAEALWLFYFIFSKRVKTRYYPISAKNIPSTDKNLRDIFNKL